MSACNRSGVEGNRLYFPDIDGITVQVAGT